MILIPNTKLKIRQLLLFVPALVFGLMSCSPEASETEESPNIVWIVSEDNSKHYMHLFDSNGVQAPNIESLAENGVTYSHAFSNSPVCSAARSTLISSCYGPRLSSHYHRNIQKVLMPGSLEMFPAYLRKAGYYTTNNAKEDYNIEKSDSVWDESSKKASWRNRKEGQPFFHVFNIGTTHESRLHFSMEDMKTTQTKTNPDLCFVQPNHPQTELFKYTNAYYRDKIVEMDKEVGAVIAELKKDGLLENTIVFYYGDHGGVLPASKGYLLETGLHVPLVVSVPSKFRHLVNHKTGTVAEEFVSFVDFGATVLNIAGVEIPEGMDGKPFLGKNIDATELSSRDRTYGYADRFDEKYDMVRTLRKGKYKYIRNYQPFNFDGLMNNYRYKQLAYKEWETMNAGNLLNEIQTQFFRKKQAEALYNVESDPFETNNLAENELYSTTLIEMRNNLDSWIKDMPDLSFYPEFYLIQHAFTDLDKFGKENKKNINEYIDIANLIFADFETVKPEIEKSLMSSDAWKRYWGLITCSSFGNEAEEMIELAKQIAQTDSELINKVRAAEFLGLIGEENPVEVMTKALYNSKDEAEALLIFNSIILMKDGANKYKFAIQPENLAQEVRTNNLIKQRLIYLNQQ